MWRRIVNRFFNIPNLHSITARSALVEIFHHVPKTVRSSPIPQFCLMVAHNRCKKQVSTHITAVCKIKPPGRNLHTFLQFICLLFCRLLTLRECESRQLHRHNDQTRAVGAAVHECDLKLPRSVGECILPSLTRWPWTLLCCNWLLCRTAFPIVTLVAESVSLRHHVQIQKLVFLHLH